MRRAWAALWGLLLLWAAPLFPAASFALAQSRDERAVRAAYVYNLLQYVDWPDPRSELVIGFEGDPATGAILRDLLNGRTGKAHPIRVVLFPSSQELRSCSILYLNDSTTRETRETLDRVHGQTVLTVGETDSFTRGGGMVALVNTGDHIRIEVNLEATQRAGIRISSRVLDLATIVHSAQKDGR